MSEIYDYEGQIATVNAGKKAISFEMLYIGIYGGEIPVKEILSAQIIESDVSIGIILTVRNKGHLLTDKHVAALLNPPLLISIPNVLEGEGRIWKYDDVYIDFFFTGAITKVNEKVVEAINETIHELIELRAKKGQI